MVRVGLVVCGSTDTEWHAIRAVLESFGARVVLYLVGRPNDFIDVIKGKSLYPDIDCLIISAHGENGAFLLPELAKEYYDENEPQVTQFDAGLVEKYGRLEDRLVLTTGCTLGSQRIAETFIKIGCRRYIGPDGYVESTATLMFVVRFYYELIANQRSEQDAFHIASQIDNETALFKSFHKKAAQC